MTAVSSSHPIASNCSYSPHVVRPLQRLTPQGYKGWKDSVVPRSKYACLHVRSTPSLSVSSCPHPEGLPNSGVCVFYLGAPSRHWHPASCSVKTLDCEDSVTRGSVLYCRATMIIMPCLGILITVSIFGHPSPTSSLSPSAMCLLVQILYLFMLGIGSYGTLR